MRLGFRSKATTVAAVGLLVAAGTVAACKLTDGCPLGLLRSDRPAEEALRDALRADPGGGPASPNRELQHDNNLSGGDAMSTIHSAAARIEHASDADFGRKVLESDVPVLVDFYADWCGPCRLMAPVLEEFARENPGAKVVKVNVDHSPGVAMQYEISAIPTLAAFRGGEVTAQHVGLANKEQLKRMLSL